MMDWLFKRKMENRSSLENPSVPISHENVVRLISGADLSSNLGPVTVDSALGVPAIFCAVNVIAGSLAGLPLNLYRKTGETRKRLRDPLACLLHDYVNDETTSFDWRKRLFDSVLTHGRGVSFIERSLAGKIINFWPLDYDKLTIRRVNGHTQYVYQDGGRAITYEAHEVIDIKFMLRSDGLSVRSPIYTNKDTIQQARAIKAYGSKFFAGGGVPPFAIEGPFETPGGMQRAADDLASSVKKAAQEERLALAIPKGHTIKPIGAEPEKSQLTPEQRFMIEEIARIWNIPPVFLQDLTHGTFSNTEQQGIAFVKYTLKPWVEQFEQELNLKLFGRSNKAKFVELNMDGFLRGDFATRMAGYATGIQNAILTPNEVRAKENLEGVEQGGNLLIQGATVELGSQGDLGQQQGDDDER